MDGFDTMTMPYLASPLGMNPMPNGDYMTAMPQMDMQPPQQPYDAESFVRYGVFLPVFEACSLARVLN